MRENTEAVIKYQFKLSILAEMKKNEWANVWTESSERSQKKKKKKMF